MIEIVPMTIAHAYILAKDLREGDRLECEALGMTPKQALRDCYYRSLIKKTIMVDDEVAACFGGTGSALGPILHPWLLTSPKVEKAYLTLASAYRKQVKSMSASYPKLENYCLASYTKSLNLLKLVGFIVSDPVPYGKHGELFCRFSAGIT